MEETPRDEHAVIDEPEPTPLTTRVVSRRRVLGGVLGAAAVTAAGTTALVERGASPAAASDGSDLVLGDANTAEARTSVVYDGASGFTGAVLLGNDSTYSGTTAAYPAALGGWAGAGSTAGKGGVANGVYGFTDNGAGYGVVALNTGLVPGSGGGLLASASSTAGSAVSATNIKGTAISATSASTEEGATAVLGQLTNTSPGVNSAAVRGLNAGTGDQGIGVWGSQSGTGWGVYATSAGGVGLKADAGNGTGVDATGGTALSAAGVTVGVSASGPTAVQASGTTVALDASGPTAVMATGTTTGISASAPRGIEVTSTVLGVSVTAPTGILAKGTGDAGTALSATTDALSPSVHVTNYGGGPGLQAVTEGSPAEGTAAVVGNSKSGTGVLGLSAQATAVDGRSQSGRGGSFSGSLAQVRLVPGSLPGHPPAGEMGDLYCDAKGRLWFCKSGGVHPNWKQLA